MILRFGRYELLQVIGQGGMAEVFLARQRGIGGFEKRLVIKRILPTLARDPRFLRLFFEEARLHASLSHGNLVPIFDFGRVGNDYFLAMDLVDGCDLSHLLRSSVDHSLPAELVAYIGAELCHALQHVHRHGLVHRDSTPRNVLLSLDGEVKLADFGVARTAADASGMRGTLAYMAPEQARGENVDARADLYSLGLILAEAATGARVREQGVQSTELVDRIQGAGPVSIAGPFAALVARATAPMREDRFADASEMASELESIAGQLGGQRATSARILAGRVRACAPERAPVEHAASEEKEEPAPATYYRDATTAGTLVDDIVVSADKATTPTQSKLRAAAIVAALCVLGSATWITSVWKRRPHSPPYDDKTARPARSSRPVAQAPERPTPASPAASVVEPMARDSPPRREPPVAEGTVEVRCRPWCVVDVDGHRRGEDGRRHSLRLATGRHRVTLERLEDRQTRSVEIHAGEKQTLEVVFD